MSAFLLIAGLITFTLFIPLMAVVIWSIIDILATAAALIIDIVHESLYD